MFIISVVALLWAGLLCMQTQENDNKLNLES